MTSYAHADPHRGDRGSEEADLPPNAPTQVGEIKLEGPAEEGHDEEGGWRPETRTGTNTRKMLRTKHLRGRTRTQCPITTSMSTRVATSFGWSTQPASNQSLAAAVARERPGTGQNGPKRPAAAVEAARACVSPVDSRPFLPMCNESLQMGGKVTD